VGEHCDFKLQLLPAYGREIVPERGVGTSHDSFKFLRLYLYLRNGWSWSCQILYTERLY